MSDFTFELVGYAVADRPGSINQVYACLEHTPERLRQSHRMLFRDEAIAESAKCRKCKAGLGEVPTVVLA